MAISTSEKKEQIMTLGLCCQFLEPRTKRNGTIVYENSINELSLQFGNYNKGKYSQDYIKEIYHNNVKEIIKLIPKLISNNIKSFRISSSLLPLFDLNTELAFNDKILQNLLSDLGNLFILNNIRVTTHPGQFTVLSSDNPAVVVNAIKDLSYHAWVFDCMNLPQTPYAAINIHGGKGNRCSNLISGINSLPSNVRSRLTLENDESCYSVSDLLPVHDATGVPIVFDSHHATFNNDNLSLQESCDKAIDTWSRLSIKPLQHISNSTPGTENANFITRRKHSDYIHKIPECQLMYLQKDAIDIDVEAKMKNLALIQIRNELNLN